MPQEFNITFSFFIKEKEKKGGGGEASPSKRPPEDVNLDKRRGQAPEFPALKKKRGKKPSGKFAASGRQESKFEWPAKAWGGEGKKGWPCVVRRSMWWLLACLHPRSRRRKEERMWEKLRRSERKKVKGKLVVRAEQKHPLRKGKKEASL